ncbi:TPA: hypothetical protein ACOJ80_001849, partial [Streptococcus pneumoniae]
TEKVKRFDEVFLIFSKKNRPCPEVGELEGAPSKSIDLIRFYFTFFVKFNQKNLTSSSNPDIPRRWLHEESEIRASGYFYQWLCF